MTFGQLLISAAIVRETVGNPIRENVDFSDPLSNGDPFLDSFRWLINSSVRANAEGSSEGDVTKVQTSTEYYNSSTSNYPETHNADSISIIWYLASFGTLVMFFLLISFSEVCCKKSFTAEPEIPEVSPPPYDLFAPPTYESLYAEKKEKSLRRKKKGKCEVFVIHIFGDKNKSQLPPSETMPRNSTVNDQREMQAYTFQM